jgi:hypothetical protein
MATKKLSDRTPLDWNIHTMQETAKLMERNASRPRMGLDYVRTMRLALDNAEKQLVMAARLEGHSWDSIGFMLGISKQAAHKKFSDLDSRAVRESLVRL